MPFASLRLAEPILRAVAAEGYSTPTPIQKKAIPHILEGKDILGCAQTGTGKTAAFALPILHLLTTHAPVAAENKSHGTHTTHASHAPAHSSSHAPRTSHAQPYKPRVLVLSPTRELAVQIGDSFQTYGRHTGLRHAVIFGGVGQGAQVSALKRGVDILVATPGRLIDLLDQRYVDLSHIEIFVLDEADRMLDMGFIAPIRRIVSKIPAKRQTLMFSATMPADIRRLAESILKNPVGVEVAPVTATTELVKQSVYFVDKRSKPALLTHVLQASPVQDRTLVFTRTKHGADRLVKDLHFAGIKADAIHGNKRQNIRQRTLENFRSGRVPVLIATDIAARGIDIDEIALVVNYDVPNVPETYVHRIGRTGRAGASGRATAFCDHEERAFLRDIEKLIRKQIPVMHDKPEFAPRGQAEAPRPHARPTNRAHHASLSSHAPAHSPSRSPSHAPSHGAGHRSPRADHPNAAGRNGHFAQGASNASGDRSRPAHKAGDAHHRAGSSAHAGKGAGTHAASGKPKHTSHHTSAAHAPKPGAAHNEARRNFRGGHMGKKR